MSAESTLIDFSSPHQPTWCPGCGNYVIFNALKQALVQLRVDYSELLIVFGIGCCGNMADFIKTYGIHSLHGRGIPNAVGAKLANHKLKVIVIGGDGDLYGEGLNHMISAARGNHDITVLVHDNQMYSLTTGQTSPTTDKGTKTKSTPEGVIETGLNPLSLMLAANASFIARGYAGKIDQLVQLIKAGITHEGFSILDICQPCPTFNLINTYQWFNQRVYDLAQTDYDYSDKKLAWDIALNKDKLATGVIYQDESMKAYHKQISNLADKSLLDQFPQKVNLANIYQPFLSI